ncbi:MAG: rhomboid family protein [Candidatus Pacebacteria bacterium]|nr:rhomboid family protein [Candidatus Paceibacterota bacterium]
MNNGTRSVIRQRCFNHAAREAVARCPECGRFFCRECITEHGDRVLCATCLARFTEETAKSSGSFQFLMAVIQLLSAVLILWFVFYYAGQILLRIPSAFHEGTLWSTRE